MEAGPVQYSVREPVLLNIPFKVEAGPVQYSVREPVLPWDPGRRQTQALRRQQPQLSLAQGHRRNTNQETSVLCRGV